MTGTPPAAAAHVVALSGGKDSTALALRLAELEPSTPFEYVCTPTGAELPEMEAHWDRFETMLGAPILRLTPASLPAQIVTERMLPNPLARWCTRKLKLIPFRAYLTRRIAEAGHAVVYVGIRADEGEVRDETGAVVEAGRGNVYSDEPNVTERHPLSEWGWGLPEVAGYLVERDAVPPWRTDCYQCPFQTLGEWWILWHEYPELFARAEAQEAYVSDLHGRPHTFRSDSRDSWPASLAGLRQRFERGDVPMRSKVKPRMYAPDLFLGTSPPDLMAERTGMCRVCTL